MEEFKNEQEKVLDIIKQIDEQNNGIPGESKVEEISQKSFKKLEDEILEQFDD